MSPCLPPLLSSLCHHLRLQERPQQKKSSIASSPILPCSAVWGRDFVRRLIRRPRIPPLLHTPVLHR